MASTCQATYYDTFSWMETLEFRFKFQWNLFPRVQLKQSSIGVDNGLATSRYLSQWWHSLPSLLTHICVIRPQWIKIKQKNSETSWLNLNSKAVSLNHPWSWGWMGSYILLKFTNLIIHPCPHVNQSVFVKQITADNTNMTGSSYVMACWWRRTYVVKLLIDNGIEINIIELV